MWVGYSGRTRFGSGLYPFYKLNLNSSDLETIKTFSEFINKDWVSRIVKLWVTDAEVNSSFQVMDVFVIASLVVLVSNAYTKHFTFHDLLSIIDEIYVPDEKSAHIITGQLIIGILFGSKAMSPEFWEERDEYVSKYLKRILNEDLSPDNQGIWHVFAAFLPGHVDVRRFPKVIDVILNFQLILIRLCFQGFYKNCVYERSHRFNFVASWEFR